VSLDAMLDLRSFVTDGRQALLLHETIESGLSTGNGIAPNHAAIQRGNLKAPPIRRHAGFKSPRPGLPRGEGREFYLDILFHRKSELPAARLDKWREPTEQDAELCHLHDDNRPGRHSSRLPKVTDAVVG